MPQKLDKVLYQHYRYTATFENFCQLEEVFFQCFQLAITHSKLTIETLGQGVKYVQS